MKKILIVTYGGGHVDIQIPIIKNKIDKYVYTVISLTNSKFKLDKNNIYYNNLTDFLSTESKINVKTLGAELAKEFHNTASGLNMEDSVNYMGFLCYDFYKKYGITILKQKIRKEGFKNFTPYSLVNEVVDGIKPNLIIVSSNARVEKIFTQISRGYKIPTLRIIGLLGLEVDKSYASHNLVMSDDVKNNLKKNNISSESIFVTGQPSFENIIKSTKEEKSIYDIAYFTQKIPFIKKYCEEIYQLAFLNPSLKVAIKFHPSHNDKEFEKKFSSLKNVKIENIDSNLLIMKSDNIVTHFSTCAIEANLLNKNTLILKCNDDIFPIDMHKHNIGILVENKDGILKELNKEKKSNLREHNLNAVKNINDLIKKILG